MKQKKRHPYKRYTRYAKKRSGGKKKRNIHLKPGVDPGLKAVLSTIGVPDPKPFSPDPFQTDAVTAIKHSDCLVTAPTGAGKTWIAREAISRILETGGRSWYASPLKALSNAKYLEFTEFFGQAQVGILTGDRKENPDAPIVIGTTEILRNQLYDAMSRGKTLATDLVILDEAHFLGDDERGVVWEEVMIYLPSRIPLLLLSATIGNNREIAGWLAQTRHRKCEVVEEKKRPVPLSPIFLHPSGTLYPLTTQNTSGKKSRIHKKASEFIHMKRPPRLAPPGRLPPFGDIIRVLKKFNLLPAIFFLKSRRDCDSALELCVEKPPIQPDHQDRLKTRFERLARQSPHISRHRQIWHLENLAVGSHHSGQLPIWKLVIENLMSDGLLEAVFATSTVAAGVNFPARTVVFLNSDRYNGIEFLPLTSTEFHQMTGRAGRRGMDNIGFAMAVPGKFMNLGLCAKLVNEPPSNIYSQIRINFSMVLNLLLSHTPAQVEDLLDRSFATYQHLKRKKGHPGFYDPKFLWKDFQRHLEFLIEEGYAKEDGRLTDDGVWASKLRVDHPLHIAEGFRQGVIPDSDPTVLAGIIASFVDEGDTKIRFDNKQVPKKLLSEFKNVFRGLRPFSRHMTAHGFDVKPLFFKPVLAVHHWASGMPWENVVPMAEMEEGTFARLIFRTADNLRHIRSLSRVFPRAAESSKTAIELILRDPVETGL